MTSRAKKKLQTYHAMMTVTRTEEWCVVAAALELAAHSKPPNWRESLPHRRCCDWRSRWFCWSARSRMTQSGRSNSIDRGPRKRR